MLVDKKLAKKTQTMSQAFTIDERRRRQSVDELLTHLSNSSSCVIPTSMLRILFDDNMTLLKEANEINRNIASSLEILANKIPSNDETDTFNTVIATKLDNLVAAISTSNSALVSQPAPAPVQQNIQKELKERATLFEKSCVSYTQNS